jgi:hypothetical protein
LTNLNDFKLLLSLIKTKYNPEGNELVLIWFDDSINFCSTHNLPEMSNNFK